MKLVFASFDEAKAVGVEFAVENMKYLYLCYRTPTEQKGNNWLEPMREVILLSSQAKILLSQGDKTQIRVFLKNVGSNFMLNSKRLEISPKNGWRARVAGEPMTSFPNWR